MDLSIDSCWFFWGLFVYFLYTLCISFSSLVLTFLYLVSQMCWSSTTGYLFYFRFGHRVFCSPFSKSNWHCSAWKPTTAEHMLELRYLDDGVILVLYGKYHLFGRWRPRYKESTGFSLVNLLCLSQSKPDVAHRRLQSLDYCV